MSQTPKSERVVFFNGKLVPESQARLSIYDSALMFGDVAFEMTRSFNKKQFKLREHLERLMASAKWLRIPISMSIDELEQRCNEVIEANDLPASNQGGSSARTTPPRRGLVTSVPSPQPWRGLGDCLHPLSPTM